MPLNAYPSERKVHAGLAGALPSGWSAWHSLKIRTKTGEFSEADFVIADPARGILVLEVKGGSIRKEGGIWLQNGRPLKAAPLDQAHRFVRALLAKAKECEFALPPIGVAAAFPDTDFESQPSQGDLEGIVLGARELAYLQEILPDLLGRALPTGLRRRPSPGWVEFLHSLWCESWPRAMSLSCVVKGRREARVRLDREQFTALESVLDNDLVLVRGGAGTGKTLLARELALREAGAGRKVLVLTFTEALGLELAAAVGGQGIEAAPVGRLALERLRRRGFDEEERYEPGFWERVTRLAAESGALWKGCGFDTVIVDEGQDFGRHEWAIAVVSLRGMMYEGNIMHRGELGGCRTAQATDLEGRDRIVCDTFLRYKGLERPVVVIADVLTGAERYPVRMNIAVSRAFGALRVVAGRGEMERDAILMRILALARAS